MDRRYQTGMCVRRSVLGDAHVDRAEATITRRERSMLTLALFAATGNFEEIPLHVRATAKTGATENDVLQALHVAIYAGVPRANHAIKLAKATYTEMEEPSQ